MLNDYSKDEILLDKQMIPYKEHIRKIVEASTIHKRNNFDTHQETMRIIAENPTTKIVSPRWLITVVVAYVIGVISCVYIYLI